MHPAERAPSVRLRGSPTSVEFPRGNSTSLFELPLGALKVRDRVLVGPPLDRALRKMKIGNVGKTKVRTHSTSPHDAIVTMTLTIIQDSVRAESVRLVSYGGLPPVRAPNQRRLSNTATAGSLRIHLAIPVVSSR